MRLSHKWTEPQMLHDATEAFAFGSLVEALLGKELRIESILHKPSQWEDYHLAISPREIERYTPLF